MQNHLHPTERGIYGFSMLCVIGFVALLPWGAGSHSRPVSGAYAVLTQHSAPVRTVTASVEEAQNFAAERVCRGVISGTRCATFLSPTSL